MSKALIESKASTSRTEQSTGLWTMGFTPIWWVLFGSQTILPTLGIGSAWYGHGVRHEAETDALRALNNPEIERSKFKNIADQLYNANLIDGATGIFGILALSTLLPGGVVTAAAFGLGYLGFRAITGARSYNYFESLSNESAVTATESFLQANEKQPPAIEARADALVDLGIGAAWAYLGIAILSLATPLGIIGAFGAGLAAWGFGKSAYESWQYADELEATTKKDHITYSSGLAPA